MKKNQALEQFANASTITDDGTAVETRRGRWRDYYDAKKEKLSEQFHSDDRYFLFIFFCHYR